MFEFLDSEIGRVRGVLSGDKVESGKANAEEASDGQHDVGLGSKWLIA